MKSLSQVRCQGECCCRATDRRFLRDSLDRFSLGELLRISGTWGGAPVAESGRWGTLSGGSFWRQPPWRPSDATGQRNTQQQSSWPESQTVIFGGHRSTGLHREHRRVLEPWGGFAPCGENRDLHHCHRVRAAGPRSYGGPRSVRWPLRCWPRPVRCRRRVELD